jgi:hypothetical protein
MRSGAGATLPRGRGAGVAGRWGKGLGSEAARKGSVNIQFCPDAPRGRKQDRGGRRSAYFPPSPKVSPSSAPSQPHTAFRWRLHDLLHHIRAAHCRRAGAGGRGCGAAMAEAYVPALKALCLETLSRCTSRLGERAAGPRRGGGGGLGAPTRRARTRSGAPRADPPRAPPRPPHAAIAAAAAAAAPPAPPPRRPPAAAAPPGAARICTAASAARPRPADLRAPRPPTHHTPKSLPRPPQPPCKRQPRLARDARRGRAAAVRRRRGPGGRRGRHLGGRRPRHDLVHVVRPCSGAWGAGRWCRVGGFRTIEATK